MAIKINKNFTKRNRFTRMCIGEAIIALLEKQSYDSIKVSDIVRRTGISRMTYYQYYHSKEEALEDYLHEIVALYIKECEQNMTGKFHDYEHILHALLYFDQYAEYFLRMVQVQKYSVMVNAINQYMLDLIAPRYSGSVYDLYFYSGALLNIFIKWEEEGKKEPAEKIAETICGAFATIKHAEQ